MSNQEPVNEKSHQENFKELKEKIIQENEVSYGEQLRQAYGDEIIDASNEKIRKMSQTSHDKARRLSIIIIEKLKEGFVSGEIQGPLAEEIYELHKDWIMCYWSSYLAKAHKGLADLYIEDKRFKEYYDKEQDGLAKYLRDIIYANAVD